MIEVKNVTKTFGSFKALDNISMNVPSNAVYGLVGPNGAGKSTVIRNLTGIYRPDAGEILFDGRPIYENTAVKEECALIPDDWFYFYNSSIKEMMELYKGIYPSFNVERFNKLKEAFPIDDKRQIKTLSKGMLKQVAFRLALSTMPKYLILDEPVDGLDPVMRRQVWSLIMNDVSEYGTTVLVSSHNLRELEDVCDHVGIMDKGRLIIERDLAKLQDNMVKLQVVFDESVTELPEDIPVLNASKVGRVHTLIMRMNKDEAVKAIAPYKPLLVDALPLTLEEIFVYELGGEDYAVKEIIL